MAPSCLSNGPSARAVFSTASRLDIELQIDQAKGPGFRAVTLTGTGSFAARLASAKAVHELLERSGWSGAERIFMQGDASARSYERLVKAGGETAILMISPPRPDGPPVRYGKSYSAIAKLAEDIRPFIAVGNGLRSQGLSAPEILAFDLDAGLAVIEDLGGEPVTSETGIIEERYAVALAALAHLHSAGLSDTLPITDDETYRIPVYDVDALSIEVELLLDWYLPSIACVQVASGAKATFVNLWRHAVQNVLAARPTWTLRDYHSPNLIWLAGREGIARMGIIDFQDCVLGHPLMTSSHFCRTPASMSLRRWNCGCFHTMPGCGARPMRVLTRRVLPAPMRFWGRSAQRKSLAFLRVSTNATRNPNILCICRASKDIWLKI